MTSACLPTSSALSGCNDRVIRQDRELAAVVAVIGAGPNGRVASPRTKRPVATPHGPLDDGISSTTVSIRAVPDERRAAMRGDCAPPHAPRWPRSGSHPSRTPRTCSSQDAGHSTGACNTHDV